MATVKFLLQAKKDNAQIHVRLTNGRKLDLKKSTGFSIDSKDWSDKTNLPKQTKAENKLLINNLNRLSGHLYSVLNEDFANGVLLDSNWLDRQIKACFNRIEVIDRDIFTNYIEYMIDNASTKETKGGKIGLSKGTIKNYRSFKKIILEFEQELKQKILFKDINKTLTDRFKTWLLTSKKYTVNYAGKQFEFIKMVCRDAQRNDIFVSSHSVEVNPFRQQDKDRYIHTLSFTEIDKIFNTMMPTPHLENVKKWILIGCFIGQRGGDLLKLTPANLRQVEKGVYIDLIQEKTDKNITIGVNKDFVLDILLNGFPKPVSINKINSHIKKVCEIAKIDEKVDGYFVNKETGVKELVNMEKYNFITSHCFRRSFATNFYGFVPTPTLMGITGHSEESVFLKYINKRRDKDANANVFLSYTEKGYK